MAILEKLKVLGMGAKYDNCGCSVSPKKIPRVADAISNAIFETSTEGGKTTKLFKTLMSNACTHDCSYCLNSTSCKNSAQKVALEPEELARTFRFLLKKGYVTGLFLSSAVTGNPDRMAEKMVEAVSIVRHRYNFKGYIHMKVLPGTSYDLVKRSAELSHRLSINIESPSKARINEISSTKDYKNDILKRQS